VTATFGPKDTPPIDLLEDWIDESYRAQAPKKLVSSLPADPRRRKIRPAGSGAGKKARRG
jgi:hypothetical protein